MLLQELRRRAAHTSCARAQVATLRERLLKIGVHVTVSVRRIVLHLPRSFPFLVPLAAHRRQLRCRGRLTALDFPEFRSPADDPGENPP